MSGLDDIIEQITDEKTIQRWKELAAKEIRAFSKRANPFHGLKVSNYYLYIDTKTRSYSIELQGVKPNAGNMRGFTAPIDQRQFIERPQRVLFGQNWKTVHTERKTSERFGTFKKLDINYYGVSSEPNKYFGIRRKGVKAFGIADGTVVPIYADYSFVEFITQDMQKELFAILQNAGYTAINGG